MVDPDPKPSTMPGSTRVSARVAATTFNASRSGNSVPQGSDTSRDTTWMMEDGAPCDEDRSAGCYNQWGSARVDAPVHLDFNVGRERTNPADFLGTGLDERLATKSRLHRHDVDLADVREDLAKRFHGRGWINRRARPGTGGHDRSKRP